MKIRLVVALVGLAIWFAVPTFAQQKEPTPSEQDRQQLNAHVKKSDEAWNNNDAAALAATFTEDAANVTNKGPIYGRAAIEKRYADLLKQFHVSNHLNTVDEEWSNGDATDIAPVIIEGLPVKVISSGKSYKVFEQYPWEGLSSNYGPKGNRLNSSYGVGLGKNISSALLLRQGDWIHMPDIGWRQINEFSSKKDSIEFFARYRDEYKSKHPRITIDMVVFALPPEKEAKDMLWRRETRRAQGSYNPPARPGPNTVLIKTIPNFGGVGLVLYTYLQANINPPLTGRTLACLEIASARNQEVEKGTFAGWTRTS